MESRVRRGFMRVRAGVTKGDVQMSRAKRVCLALIMLVEASAVSSFPAWMKERYKELIEIAKEPNGAQQVADLYGSVDIQGLAQAIDAAWSQTPNLERKPAVRAISGREIEISYLVVPSTSISMYSEMISNPEHLRDATQGVLSSDCAPSPVLRSSQNMVTRFIQILECGPGILWPYAC